MEKSETKVLTSIESKEVGMWKATLWAPEG